jgi:hypothetical protein
MSASILRRIDSVVRGVGRPGGATVQSPVPPPAP